MDVEPDLRCPHQRIRLFEDDARVDALSALLRRNNVPLTCFVVMKHAARYGQALLSLASMVDLEFAVHSYNHDQHSPASAEEARTSWDAFCDLWNRPPSGYRSPNCLIDTQGLNNLARQGFLYDSSVTPSIRFDRFGYNNLHLPTEPFLFCSGERRILEFPIACFSGIRLPLVLSYAKLFGLAAIRATAGLLSLPKVVAVYFHPYDLYFAEIADNIPGWKRYAHLRNSRAGLRILDGLIGLLKEQGYQFMLMESAAKKLMIGNLPVLLSLDPKHYR